MERGEEMCDVCARVERGVGKRKTSAAASFLPWRSINIHTLLGTSLSPLTHHTPTHSQQQQHTMQELDQLLKQGDSQAILKYLRHNRVSPSLSLLPCSSRSPSSPTTQPKGAGLQRGGAAWAGLCHEGHGATAGRRRYEARGRGGGMGGNRPAGGGGGVLDSKWTATHPFSPSPKTQCAAWPVYEQVFLAALDLGETLLAQVRVSLVRRAHPPPRVLSSHTPLFFSFFSLPYKTTDGVGPPREAISGQCARGQAGRHASGGGGGF